MNVMTVDNFHVTIKFDPDLDLFRGEIFGHNGGADFYGPDGHADGEAKFWLTPQVVLANHTGLSATQIRQAQVVVNAHLKEIQDAWNHHFGG